jgi:hypothetical protein
MFMSLWQTTGQNSHGKVADKSLKMQQELKYLVTKVANQNYVHEEIESILNSGMLATMHISILSLLVCCLKNVKIEVFTFCFICMWKLVSHVRGEHRLRVFVNIVLRRIFSSKMDEVTGGWRKLHNEELYNLSSYC